MLRLIVQADGVTARIYNGGLPHATAWADPWGYWAMKNQTQTAEKDKDYVDKLWAYTAPKPDGVTLHTHNTAFIFMNEISAFTAFFWNIALFQTRTTANSRRTYACL